ncbi:MAG: hypothetical protein KBD00_01605 [Candidatus Peribacteraceae bacterium]|nr:hypothetical protein [Candidatus Peribacteraceae bacterium]
MKHFSFAEHRLCRFEAQPKVDNPQVAETKVEALNISQKIETILKLNSECEKIVATIPSDSTNVRDQYAKRLEAAKQHCLAAQLQASAESMVKLDSFIQELQGHKEVLQTWEMRKKGVVAEKSDQQLYANDPNGKLTSYTVEFTDGWTLEKWEPALPIRYKLYDTVIGTGKYGNTWGVHLQDGDSITVTARKGNETKTIVVKAEKPVTASPQSESITSKDTVATTPVVEKKTPTAEKPVAEKAVPSEKVSTTQVDPLKNIDASFKVAMNDTMKKIQEDPYIKGMEPSTPTETPGPSPTINTNTIKAVRDAQSTVTPDISPAKQEPIPVLSATPDITLRPDKPVAPPTINTSMDDAPVIVADLTPEELAQQKAEKEEKDRKIHATKLPEYPFTEPKKESVQTTAKVADTTPKDPAPIMENIEPPPLTDEQVRQRGMLNTFRDAITFDIIPMLQREDLFDASNIQNKLKGLNELLADMKKSNPDLLTKDPDTAAYLKRFEEKYYMKDTTVFYIVYDRNKNTLSFVDTRLVDAPAPAPDEQMKAEPQELKKPEENAEKKEVSDGKEFYKSFPALEQLDQKIAKKDYRKVWKELSDLEQAMLDQNPVNEKARTYVADTMNTVMDIALQAKQKLEDDLHAIQELDAELVKKQEVPGIAAGRLLGVFNMKNFAETIGTTLDYNILKYDTQSQINIFDTQNTITLQSLPGANIKLNEGDPPTITLTLPDNKTQ